MSYLMMGTKIFTDGLILGQESFLKILLLMILYIGGVILIEYYSFLLKTGTKLMMMNMMT